VIFFVHSIMIWDLLVRRSGIWLLPGVDLSEVWFELVSIWGLHAFTYPIYCITFSGVLRFELFSRFDIPSWISTQPNISDVFVSSYDHETRYYAVARRHKIQFA
jgi:hypothetical protein